MMFSPEERERSRQFICSCGKGYFSYAALFTHIKQKHQGKAPGPIIKPKPENKRGRPRKQHSGLQFLPSSNVNIIGKESINFETNILSGQINTNFHINTTPFPLKSTPGSQFKSYKADHSSMATTNELPLQNSQEQVLMFDLAQNLYSLPLVKVPSQLLQQFQAHKILKLCENEEEDNLANTLNRFLIFCKSGLQTQAHNQIELLVVLLLQHVINCHGKDSPNQSACMVLNDCIQSFFLSLQQYINKWNLSPYTIFRALNPTKVLVVLYNWFNRINAEQNESQGQSQANEAIKCG